MLGRWIGAAFLAGLAVGTGPLSAQQRSAAPALQTDPNLDVEDQLAPSQVRQPMPAAVPEPTRPGRPGSRTAARPTDDMAEPIARSKPSRGTAPVVACSGAFAKDSSHVKLAMAFHDKNVAYTQVDAGAGSKSMASVLFAKDPKRRLEVWWSNPVGRSMTHLIVINGQSNWVAPGGLHLGLTLAELEKLNGKPFKLLGFNKDNVAALVDWDGGTLAAPAGGCKVGVSLRAEPKTSSSALSALPADKEYSSADAALRAVNPTVSEILVAY